MNYQESMHYMDSLASLGRAPGLSNILRLLEHLNNPHLNLKSIHVGGTSGKGTLCHLMSAVLRSAGYKVGLYTSPHIFDYRETIQINSISISKEDFALYTLRIKEACDEIVKKGMPHPTVFECQTALAFLFFSERNLDFCVIEVGMGGRGDATNVITSPLVSIINSIALDHTEFLGNTIADISLEKAGIIKPNCPVILAPNPPEVVRIIQTQSLTCHAPFISLDEGDLQVVVRKNTLTGMDFSLATSRFSYPWIHTSLIGIHNIQNIAVVLTALEILKDAGIHITNDAVLTALGNASLPCRCEYRRYPLPMILDGAHNPDKLSKLVQMLNDLLISEMVIIFGALREKDVDGMLLLLQTFSDSIILTRPISHRSLDLVTLSEAAKKYFKNITVIENPMEAFEKGLFHAKMTGKLLCCVGSFYLSMPIRQYLDESF